VIVISGPTASGKTAWSIDLAERLGGEIINADSLQVYRHLDVGTAKPTAEEQARIRHHLLDVANPDEDFDAARYLGLARPLIHDLASRGLVPLVVGGTGLYLRSLLRGLFAGPGKSPEIRARLHQEARDMGWEGLHARLTRVDPITAGRLHPRDRVRIERALEVFEATGRPISSFQKDHGLAEAPFETLFFCLSPPRETLWSRIETRTQAMFDAGLVDEVRRVLAMGYPPRVKPLQSIGYRQAVAVLAGKMSTDAAITETIHKTRQLAKRQMTWYKAQPDVAWVTPAETGPAAETAVRFMANG
jgi:tRNA dimethylallyltransferase